MRRLRSVRAALTASDPGLARLRLAGTTIATLVIAVAVLFALVGVWGQPVTVAMPGVVLAMIGSIAVRETEPAPQAATIALLAPSAGVSIALALVLSGSRPVADVVFVAVTAGLPACTREAGIAGLHRGLVQRATVIDPVVETELRIGDGSGLYGDFDRDQIGQHAVRRPHGVLRRQQRRPSSRGNISTVVSQGTWRCPRPGPRWRGCAS